MHAPHKSEDMNCPACSCALVSSERQGIRIDQCPECRGVWLGRGELDKIVEQAAAAPPVSTASPLPQRQPGRWLGHLQYFPAPDRGFGRKPDRPRLSLVTLFE